MLAALSITLGLGVAFVSPAPLEPEADAPAPAPTADAQREVGTATLRFLDVHAKEARRERLTAGGVNLVLAGSQIGIGVYGIVVAADGDTGVERAAIGQTIIGGVGLAGSIVGLARRSPLERTRAGAGYARLAADPADAQAVDQLVLEWERAAKSARRRRITSASLQVGIGSALIVVSSVRLSMLGSEASSGEEVWAFTTLATAIGVALSGVPAFIIPSATERSLAAYQAVRPRPRGHVQVVPTFGGMSVSGRF